MEPFTVLDAEPPGADVIKKLEAALEMAREGRISSVAIAMVERDGSTWTSWSRPATFATLLGAATHLVWQMNKTLDQADA